MSKYISQYTPQTATQSTDIYLFQRGLTYYNITNANLVASISSDLNLSSYLTIASAAATYQTLAGMSSYLTTATAASTYVPLSREITINGTTYDLSANRSWTIPTGGNETLAQTLALGNTSGAYDILMNTSQRVGFKDGDNINTSYISNNQTTAGSRTAYLPLYTGQLAYHATGVPLTTNYVLKGTTNGAITSSSLIYDNGTNVGIGASASPDAAYKVTIDHSGGSIGSLILKQTTNTLFTEIAFYESGSSAAYIDWLNSNRAGNIFGTSISQTKTLQLFAGTAADSPVVLRGNYVYGLHQSGNGFSSNSTGFRLAPISDLHNATNNMFTVTAGNSYFAGSNGTAGARVHIVGGTSDSSAYALKVDNSSSQKVIYARNDGMVEVPGKGGEITNVAIGYVALNSRTTATDSIAFGYSALNGVQSGSRNIAIGTNAGFATATHNNNVFVGYNAGLNSTSNNNVAIGFEALTGLMTAGLNIGVGYQAGSGLTSGTNNIHIGYRAGYLTSSGSTNIFIGQEAGYNRTTSSNQLFIDNQNRGSAAADLTNSMIYGVFNSTVSSQTLRINGLLGVNVVPTAATHIQGFTSDSSAYALKVDNSSSSALLYVRNDNKVFVNTSTTDSLTVVNTYIKYSGGASDAGCLSLQVETNASENSTWAQNGIFIVPHTSTTSRYFKPLHIRHANNNGAAYLGAYYAGSQDTDLYFGSVTGGTGNPILYMDYSTGSVLIDRALGASAAAKLDVNGDVNAVSGYKFNGTAGFTGTGAYTNFTIQGGIITAAS